LADRSPEAGKWRYHAGMKKLLILAAILTLGFVAAKRLRAA
jgi:hypothetical protein